jgi:hypothetical protein
VKGYLYYLKQYIANICIEANICMQIFASEYLLECEFSLRFCKYLLQNEYFEANICQYEKILKQIFALK